MLSRNFRLQQVGNLQWLKQYYNFNAIAFSIDELVILNVERTEPKNIDLFSQQVIELSKSCFMPIAAGGGIYSIEDGYKLLHSGADKLVINTPIIEQPALISLLASTFGRQCIVVAIDCKKVGETYHTYIHNGLLKTGLTVGQMLQKAEALGAGEIYLTSIDKDGTGQGYDIKLLQMASKQTQLPIIASGGVGKYEHFFEGIQKGKVNAVSTANIYNFIKDGLTKSRDYTKQQGIPFAEWNTNLQNLYHYFNQPLT